MLASIVRRAIFVGLAAWPVAALAAPLTPAGVFQDAHPVVKVIAVGLILATLAAMVICAMKVFSGPRLSGGSAFLSGLRLGGPLAGLAGAACSIFFMCLGLANVRGPVPVQLLAPGAAEAMMLILLGLLAGAVAVFTHAAVEARIDRAVLSA